MPWPRRELRQPLRPWILLEPSALPPRPSVSPMKYSLQPAKRSLRVIASRRRRRHSSAPRPPRWIGPPNFVGTRLGGASGGVPGPRLAEAERNLSDAEALEGTDPALDTRPGGRTGRAPRQRGVPACRRRLQRLGPGRARLGPASWRWHCRWRRRGRRDPWRHPRWDPVGRRHRRRRLGRFPVGWLQRQPGGGGFPVAEVWLRLRRVPGGGGGGGGGSARGGRW